MNTKRFTLTEADNHAVLLGDSNYITNKGAALYCPGSYGDAVEYYRLASSMGNVQAISNLGYCYLYGRDIEPNLSLAVAYFRIAALRGNVDAAYKLGDIYGRDKWGIMDKELSVYFYRLAASFVIGDEWDKNDSVALCDELQKYPSLCYALAREMTDGVHMCRDIRRAYQFLKHAEKGYAVELANGFAMYEESYRGVLALLSDHRFDGLREEYDGSLPEEYKNGPVQ